MWLSGSVSDALEKVFDLTIYGASGLYPVIDTHNTELANSNTQVSF